MDPRAPSAIVMPSARQRILDAAVLLFSEASYDDVSLRDIAHAALVDVAYVHRCYGSKEKLFAHALNVSMQFGRAFDVEGEDIGKALSREVFSRDSANPKDVRALAIAIRSLSSAAARDVLKRTIEADVIAPLRGRMDRPNELRAVLTIAMMAGVGLFRDVLGYEALMEPVGGELEAIVTSTLNDVMRASQANVTVQG